jgi:CheY-like chemotaxis protein
MLQHDRRKNPRLAVRGVPAALLVAGHDLGQVVAQDVSEDGLFVAHPSPILPPGTVIALSFARPAPQKPLLVEGKVARIEAGPPTGYGVEITGAPIDLVAQLVDIAERLVRPPSARREVTRDLPSPAPDPRPTPTSRPPAVAPPTATADLVPADVLIIDDDLALAKVMVRIVNSTGHVTRVEPNSHRGAEAFEATRRHLRLAIVDLVLPDGSGEDVIRKLRQAKPGLKILAVSGLLRTTVAQRPLFKAGADAFLAKPFHAQDLAHTVTDLIGRGP